jgi:hypothetical protein
LPVIVAPPDASRSLIALPKSWNVLPSIRAPVAWLAR